MASLSSTFEALAKRTLNTSMNWILLCVLLLSILSSALGNPVTAGSTEPPCQNLTDTELCCSQTLRPPIKIVKINSADDTCCCDDVDKICATFNARTHFCSEAMRVMKIPSFDGQNVTFPSPGVAKRFWCKETLMDVMHNSYACCKTAQTERLYHRKTMTCSPSTGDVTLLPNATFQSSSLCEKKLPRANDVGPDIELRMGDESSLHPHVHVRGRVEGCSVKIQQSWLVFDLVPYKFDQTFVVLLSCRAEGRLKVKVKLENPNLCIEEDVRDYLRDKTLDVWTGVTSLKRLQDGRCKTLRLSAADSSDSRRHWVMISKRVFY